jgi:basic amino acid/polyamine antiporter, APA family
MMRVPSSGRRHRVDPSEGAGGPEGAGAHRLPRRLGVWSAAAVLVGSTIGSGIFRVPGGVAEQVGSVGAIAGVWLLGAVLALFGALTIAELAAMYPRSGGIYVFLREAYGPLPAFLFGWTELLVIRPSALGAISMIFAEYAGRFAGFGDGGVRALAVATIALLALANVRSVALGAAVQNASTVAKLVAIGGLAIALITFGDGSQGALAGGGLLAPVVWGSFGLALVSVMWAYDGWADLTSMAGEVRDPGRTLPRAIIGGVLGVVAIYLTINLAYLLVLDLGSMGRSELVAADAAQVVFGSAGVSVAVALVMVSTFGALNGAMMTGPRILFALARDGLFFRPIAAVHPRFRTPHAAILLTAALGIGFVALRTFEQLASAFVLGIWPFYVMAVAGVFRLRRRRPDLPRPYRTLGYPLVPGVFLVAALAMLASAAVMDPVPTLAGFGVILLGVPVFLAWNSVRPRAPGTGADGGAPWKDTP